MSAIEILRQQYVLTSPGNERTPAPFLPNPFAVRIFPIESPRTEEEKKYLFNVRGNPAQ